MIGEDPRINCAYILIGLVILRAAYSWEIEDYCHARRMI